MTIMLWIALIVSAIIVIIGFLMCLHYLLFTPAIPTAQLPIGRTMFAFGGIGSIVSVLAIVFIK